MEFGDNEIVVLNFKRIDLSSIQDKPGCFLDNDLWLEETESNLDECDPIEEDIGRFEKIMTKRKNEFRL